ncbi:MAG: L-fucose mutarotase [Anaerolineae bacterium]|nr:L-fucose mutarotase [Anaerolineae bacterium]
MLKGIPRILSPELLKVLMEMGHGDEIVIADGNFPAASLAQRLLRADGHGVPDLLDAILRLFPLDTFVDQPVALMDVVPGHDYKPEIWDEYQQIVSKHAAASQGDAQAVGFEFIERYAFYERARNAYAVVATGEMALYANIILKKGVVVE